MWAEAQEAWTHRLPHLERFPAHVLANKAAAIRLSMHAAISTLEGNDDPFVLVMEDDAAPFPEFDELWPGVLAELLARPGEWDYMHGCPQYKVRRNLRGGPRGGQFCSNLANVSPLSSHCWSTRTVGLCTETPFWSCPLLSLLYVPQLRHLWPFRRVFSQYTH